MFNTKLGLLKYFFFRNDRAWRSLSQDERNAILRLNVASNADREDYQNEKTYGSERFLGGENWDCSIPHSTVPKALFLKEHLKVSGPRRALEIGPGPGYVSRLIAEQASLQELCFVEVNPFFLSYLKKKSDEFRVQHPQVTFHFRQGLFPQVDVGTGYDLVALYSCLHHIPNRDDVLRKLAELTVPNGTVVLWDPAHYLPRIIDLVKKIFSRKILRPAESEDYSRFATHHFLTVGEIRSLCDRHPFRLEAYQCELGGKYRVFQFLPLWLRKYFCSEIGFVLRRVSR